MDWTKPIIEVDELHQRVRCLMCNADEEIIRRRWQREDLKLEAIEQFMEEHQQCEEKRIKLLKIQMFSRPFRPKTKKASEIARRVLLPKNAMLLARNQQFKRLGQ